MSTVISNDVVIISSGVVSSGLTVEGVSGEIDVLAGGTLTDSIATGSGMIIVENGGTIQNAFVTKSGDIWIEGTAVGLSAGEDKGQFEIYTGGSLNTGLIASGGYGLVYDGATADGVAVTDGGKYLNYGGAIRNTVVSSGGSFTVQYSTAETSGTTVLEGGVMRIVSAGKAADTILNGGFLEVDSGTAATTVVSAGSMRVNQSNTIEGAKLIGGYIEVNDATATATVVSGGSMRVSSGGVVNGATVTGGELEIASASADTVVVTGGVVRVTSDGSAQNTTVNGGQLEVTSASATGTTVQAGTASFSNASVSVLNIGAGAAVTLDSASALTGKASFESGATITVDGSVTFDTSLATAESAQITGYSAVTNGENATYSLNVAEAVIGNYLLATDAAGFRSDIAFGEYTLGLGRKAVLVDGLYYMLSLTGGSGLTLLITDEEPTLPTQVYVNGDWSDLAPGEIVTVGSTTAKIGYDAFATGDEAVEFIGGDTSVSRNLTFLGDGSLLSHLGFSSITLDADSRVTLAGAYTGISITIDATGYADFSKKVMLANEGYDSAVSVFVLGDGFGYQFLDDGVTLLVTSDLVKNTFANTAWTEESVAGKFIGDTVLAWDKNAFNSFSAAALALGEGGTLYLDGGVSADDVTLTRKNDVIVCGNSSGTTVGSITGDGGSLTVEADFSANTVAGFSLLTVKAGSVTISDSISLTENGILDFDLSNVSAGNTNALVNGLSLVTGDPTFTLTGASATGVYLLASDAAAFSSDILFGDYTLKVGETVIVDDYFAYTLGIADDKLTLTIADYVPSLVYMNSEWAGKAEGTIVTVGAGTARIGYDAFAELDPAIKAVSEDGTIEVVGGTVSFADGYSKTVTVDKDATVVGTATFDKAITINGTDAFDTAFATSETAQFKGFSFVTGNATYTLTSAAAMEGTYLLASDAATFNSDVAFGEATLKVGAEAVVVGDFTYALGITENNDLALVIAAKPEPPTPTYIAKSDVNANGISDVMFQYTGGFGQIGFWLDGTSTWQSTNATHPVDTWEVLGAYDMNANGKADSVLVGNVEVGGIKGAFIGYYVDAMDTDDNWVNISYLTNNEGYVWKNKVGNLTGSEGMNSIVWHTTDLGVLGVWTDGTDNWVSLGAGFDTNWEMVGCGDFAGTGKDTVLMSYAGGQVFYTIGIDGTATELTKSDLGWEVRAIGDFSGDGKDDIVAFHAETGLVAMWGDGSTANWSLLGQLDAADWFVVGAGDYNGDETDDLLVRQYSTGMLGYYTSGDMTQWNVLGYGVDMSWTVIA